MKNILVIFVMVLFASSCTDYKQLGDDASKEVASKIDSRAVGEIITNLKVLEEKYRDDFEDSDFKYSFMENIVKHTQNSNFIMGIYFDKWMKEVKGNTTLDFYAGPYDIRLTNRTYTVPSFQIILNIFHNGSIADFDKIGGEIKLIDDSHRGFKEISFSSNKELEEVYQLQEGQSAWVAINLFKLTETSFENNKLKEIIESFELLAKMTSPNPMEFTFTRKFDESANNPPDDYGYDDEEQANEETDYDENYESDATSSSSNTDEFDEWLESYEKYLTKYIELIKKAKNGDMSVMAEYAEVGQGLVEAGIKMDNAKGDFTPEQLAKLMKLQMKMANAAQEMMQ
jgi:hypothetical protein